MRAKSSLSIRDTALRISSEPGDLQLELSREQDVVAVQILDEISTCQLAARLSRESGPGVGLVYRENLARMLSNKLVDNSRGVVCGAIIHNDDLDRAIALRQDARDSFE